MSITKKSKTLSSDNFEQDIQEHLFRSSINRYSRKFGCSLEFRKRKQALANCVPSELDLVKNLCEVFKTMENSIDLFFLIVIKRREGFVTPLNSIK